MKLALAIWFALPIILLAAWQLLQNRNRIQTPLRTPFVLGIVLVAGVIGALILSR